MKLTACFFLLVCSLGLIFFSTGWLGGVGSIDSSNTIMGGSFNKPVSISGGGKLVISCFFSAPSL